MASATGELEAVLSSGVVLRDVSEWMPVSRKRKPKTRDVAGIVRCYTHHSGANGPYGYIGAKASARYVVNQRGFPSGAYTFWISQEPDRDEEGRIAIYRMNPDERRSWHTGGEANAVGVAICWQGNLRRFEPTPEQIEAAEALYPWVAARYGLDSPEQFGMHSEADEYNVKIKVSCPGPYVEAWVREWRETVEPLCKQATS